MQYRTATRLTDIRLVFNRGKYLYCDTDMILPVGSRISPWSGKAFKLFSSVSESAVLISAEDDEALLRVLLARNHFVISLRSSDYASYQEILNLVLNENLKGFSGSVEGISLTDFILRAYMSRRKSAREDVSLDYHVEKIRRYTGNLVGQNLYLTKVPEDIALILWSKLVGEAPIYYYELDEGGSITKLNLVEELDKTCTNFESTVEYGCTTCEDRKGCLNYLSGGQLSSDDFVGNLSLAGAKKLLTKEGLNYIPPSVVKSGYSHSVEGKLDYSGVNISSGDTAEKYRLHRLRYEKLKKAAKFHKEQCSHCLKVDICGTKGHATSEWRNGSFQPYINEDYCRGQKYVEVTPANIESYIRIILELLLYNAGYNASQYDSKGLALIPNIATSKLISWILEGSRLDKHASACIRHIESCPDRHYPASVIPVEIEQALRMLRLRGGYLEPNTWWSHAMTNSSWIESKTEFYEGCFPGIPSYTKNKWVVMALPRNPGKVASPGGKVWYGAVAESIDTTLYANIYNLRVSNNPLKRFSSIESRINLVLSAIKLYVSPVWRIYFGPFGGKKDYAPASSVAQFSKNTKLNRNSWYFTKRPADLSNTELVLDILTDIAKTPAKYNLHSLELLSSLGELV